MEAPKLPFVKFIHDIIFKAACDEVCGKNIEQRNKGGMKKHKM